jgi:hypothetical protein
MTLELFTSLGYVGASLFGLVFFAQYVRTPWHKHPWGRHVMAFTVVVELILLLSLARRFLGDYPGRAVILAAMAWLFCVVMAQRAWVQWRGSHPARGQHATRPPEHPATPGIEAAYSQGYGDGFRDGDTPDTKHTGGRS